MQSGRDLRGEDKAEKNRKTGPDPSGGGTGTDSIRTCNTVQRQLL